MNTRTKPLAAFLLFLGILAPHLVLGTGKPPIDLSGFRVVDLTYSFDDKTIYWPNAPSNFQLNRLSYGKTDAGFFYSSNSFCTPEHGGTHLDAPIHFAEGKRTADQIPVEQLIAPAVVIDIADKAASDADYRLTVDDVRAWEAKNGAVPAGSIVLLRTGWGKRWPDRKRYLGDDTPGDTTGPEQRPQAVEGGDQGVAVGAAEADHPLARHLQRAAGGPLPYREVDRGI